ncbi:hypothetical protein ABGB18_34835 [Nonomuraea sp. B12E4]|uniref:hypothetical protein n=1 Tax=Nonomuraea sp. B12E4 TaxID=3153564 RepID=UPI00325E8B6C
MIIAILIACEIAFWLLLVLALATRYLWKRRKLSTALLIAIPFLDVILLVTAAVDMKGGATADITHGLAATYLAYSIVFGHSTIRWADAKFHHRYADGPPPPKPPPGGRARTRYEWRFWLRLLLAYAISCVVILALTWWVDDPTRTRPLLEFMLGLARVPVIAVLWPISHTLWPRKVESAEP